MTATTVTIQEQIHRPFSNQCIFRDYFNVKFINVNFKQGINTHVREKMHGK